MDKNVIKHPDYNPDKLIYFQRQERKTNVGLRYNKGNNDEERPHILYLQTPCMYVPFNCSTFTNRSQNGNNKVKYYLDLSFKDKDTKPDINNFYQKLKKTDIKIKKDCYKKYSQEWFCNKLTINDVKERYVSPIKKPKNDKFPDTLKISLKTDFNNKILTEIFDQEENELSNTDLVKGIYVIALIYTDNIWLMGDKFGYSWTADQLMVYTSNPNNPETDNQINDEIDNGTQLSGNCLRTDDDDEKPAKKNNSDKKNTPKKVVIVKKKAKKNTKTDKIKIEDKVKAEPKKKRVVRRNVGSKLSKNTKNLFNELDKNTQLKKRLSKSNSKVI